MACNNQLNIPGSSTYNKCKPMTIPDSDRAFDPLIGSQNPDYGINIMCNDGYSFNHDLLHKSGKVKCDVDIVDDMDDDITPSYSWYVFDKTLEHKCFEKQNKDTCEGINGSPTPTYNPQDIYIPEEYIKDNLYDLEIDRLHGGEPFHLHCKWDASVSGPSACKFRVKVDNKSTQEPICKPQYCPEKIIPNSSRDGIQGYPLPGPKQGSSVGECINDDDGTIYTQITDVQDCLCYKHNSCNTCSHNKNCKWCGSDTDNPGCYGINSSYPMCDTNTVREPGGGSCTDIEGLLKPGWNDKNIMEQTIDQCENEFKCTNILDGDEIPISGPSSKLSLYGMQELYKKKEGPINAPSLKSADLCNSYNNTYYPDISDKQIKKVESPGKAVCYLNKDIPETYKDYNGLPFGIISTDITDNNYISIQPNICVPGDTKNIGCYGKNDKQTCLSDDCLWESNKFDNNIVYWADQKDNLKGSGDKINFIAKQEGQEGQDYTCPSGPIEVEKINNGYIELLNTTVTPSDALYCNIQYINTSDYSRNNIYNTYSKFFTSRFDSYSPPYTCLGTVKDGMCQPLSGQTEYNWPTTVPTDPLYIGFYSAFQNSETYGNITEDTCKITGYTVSSSGIYSTESPTMDKNYAICNFPEDDPNVKQTLCNHLNKTTTVEGDKIDTVHWGEMCVNRDTSYRSLKNLCETNKENYEWIKDWNGGGTCVTTDNQTNVNCPSFPNFINLDGGNKCIIETPTSMDGEYVNQICEKWKVVGSNPPLDNIIDFKYEKIVAEEKQDHCDPGISFYIPGVNTLESQYYINKNEDNCTINNLDYVKKYKYSNINYCKRDQISNISNTNLRWTGGDLTSDNDGTWKKECNSSILGSCNVECDTGYGGGGQYTCHYNNDAGDVCKHIEARFCHNTSDKFKNCLLPGSREKECNKYPSCYYTAPTGDKDESCSTVIDPDLTQGQPEWIGSRCYPLDNKAFAHGIYDLPLLNDVFPPLSRLIVFFIIVIILTFIMYKLKIFKALLILFKKISFTSLRTTSRGFLVLLRDSTYGFIYVVNPQNYPNHANFISNHSTKIIIVTGISTLASIFYNWDVLTRKIFE